MAVLAQLDTQPNLVSRRGKQRRAMRLRLGQAWAGDRAVDIILHDLSVTGLLIETAAEFSVGDVIQLDVPESGTVDTEIVWHSENFYGCQFRREISNKAISAALLKSSLEAEPSERLRVEAELRQLAQETDDEDAGASSNGVSRRTKLFALGALGVAAWIPAALFLAWIF